MDMSISWINWNVRSLLQEKGRKVSYKNRMIRCAIDENFCKHVYAKKPFKKLNDHAPNNT